MKERPEFSSIITSEEFLRFYWYKTELEKICRDFRLPSYGTKAELTGYIVEFLDGKSAKEIKSVRKVRRKTSKQLMSNQITLETKLLNSGFSLNSEARAFFANYFNAKNFSFRKSMGIKMREVEKNGDLEATVLDLIEALNEEQHFENNDEEKTYQWNNFVRDFRKDKQSLKYRDIMKVASILWKIVRDSNNKKEYTNSLIVEHASKLSEYLK